MMADKSRRDILVYATLAVRATALGTPTALAANAVDVPSKYMVRSGTRESANWIAPQRHEPINLLKRCMILSHPCCWDNKAAKRGHHNMLNNRPSELIHTFVSDFPF